MSQGKKILVLTGSPRRGGNSALCADAFIDSARSAGHQVTRFDAGLKRINGCIACQRCYSKGVPCVFADDFNELAPRVEEAEMLVWVTPLYWFSFPAQLKAAIDKMYSFYIGKRDVKIKETMLIVCGETDDRSDFDGILRSYELIGRYLKWENKGTLLITHVNESGDILKTDALEKVRQLARGLSPFPR